MTVEQIRKEVSKTKKISLTHTRVYIKKFGISHLGPRQRPQQYPADAPERILRGLGLWEPQQKAA